MDLALYCPVYGYYEKEGDTIGRRGDYYTSVSVGGLFGELLAFQFAEWLRTGRVGLPKVQSAFIAEAGAHRGFLARDILTWVRRWRPDLFGSLEYWIIEPSELRRQWQRTTLVDFAPRVRWAESLEHWAAARTEPHAHPPDERAVIFSNELLDAFPVHRLGWDANEREWFEWGVGISNGAFVWERLAEEKFGVLGSRGISVLALQRFQTLTGAGVLPDGFVIEICPEAAKWWKQAAVLLPAGRLLTLDYGFGPEELLMPERSAGTLRAYHRHQQSVSLLERPGEQDITAHVDFRAIQEAGESAGLVTEALVTQANFLTSIASRTWEHQDIFGEWTSERRRRFLTLTHPEHLGRAFRVLVQSRTGAHQDSVTEHQDCGASNS